MEIEITSPLELTEKEESLLSMHSLLNIMTVLIGELNLFSLDLGDEEILRPAITIANEIAIALPNPDKTYELIEQYGENKKIILNSIEKAIIKYPQFRNTPDTKRYIDNIKSVLNILKVRIEEILARRENPKQWETINIDSLTENFVNVLAAVEKNSKGRYHIVYNIAKQEVTDYLVALKIESIDGDTITMPSVLQDVMRDIIANARKYTSPGGTITAGLADDGKEIRLVVEDNGRGIPQDEIEHIVNFGVRATNVADVKTKGGGFGLTKAYYVTKEFGGRMWIQSEITAAHHGTRITIVIPHEK